jgi:hypothetical protein
MGLPALVFPVLITRFFSQTANDESLLPNL